MVLHMPLIHLFMLYIFIEHLLCARHCTSPVNGNNKLILVEFIFQECSIYPNLTYTKLLGQKREELGGFLRSKIPL